MANLLMQGFHPDQEIKAKTQWYPVASGYGTALARGDVVTLLTDGTVASATDGDADLILGVIKQVRYTSNGKRITDTYLPALTTYSGGAFGRDMSEVEVYDDPYQEYWGCLASHTDTDTATEVQAAVGKNMDITTGAPNSTYRCSTHVLNGNAEVAVRRFRVVAVRRVPGRSIGSANLHVKVRINEGFHPFHSTAGI